MDYGVGSTDHSIEIGALNLDYVYCQHHPPFDGRWKNKKLL